MFIVVDQLFPEEWDPACALLHVAHCEARDHVRGLDQEAGHQGVAGAGVEGDHDEAEQSDERK